MPDAMGETPTVPSYVQEVVDELAAEFPGKPDALLRRYASAVFLTGTETTARTIHDLWGLFTSAIRPDHPALIPFEQLTPEQVERDLKYVAAVRRLAASRVVPDLAGETASRGA